MSTFRKLICFNQQKKKVFLPTSTYTNSYKPQQTKKMPRQPISYPINVRVCHFCHATHHRDTGGFDSIEFDNWFCNTTCYQLMRLKTGSLNFTKTNGLAKTLIDIRDKHYSANVIERNRRDLTEKLRNGTYKIIRKVHHENVQHDAVVE